MGAWGIALHKAHTQNITEYNKACKLKGAERIALHKQTKTPYKYTCNRFDDVFATPKTGFCRSQNWLILVFAGLIVMRQRGGGGEIWERGHTQNGFQGWPSRKRGEKGGGR